MTLLTALILLTAAATFPSLAATLAHRRLPSPGPPADAIPLSGTGPVARARGMPTPSSPAPSAAQATRAQHPRASPGAAILSGTAPDVRAGEALAPGTPGPRRVQAAVAGHSRASPGATVLSGAAPDALAGGASVSGALGLRGVQAAVARVRRMLARRRDRDACAAACMELCEGIAVELRAGRTAADALDRAVSELAEPARTHLAPLAAAARAGGDVEPTLAALGRRPGFGGLTGLAACWRVGAETGIGFAAVLDRLATTLRADIAHRAEVTAQLAGARSSARLLAALPIVGLLLASGLGTNPLHFLLGTPYGLACLTAGLALDTLGLLWTHRLATEAEDRT